MLAAIAAVCYGRTLTVRYRRSVDPATTKVGVANVATVEGLLISLVYFALVALDSGTTGGGAVPWVLTNVNGNGEW